MIRPRPVLAALGALGGLATHGQAQHLTAVVAVSAAEHRVDAGPGEEVSKGPLLGAGLRMTIARRWVAGLDALAGSLTAKGGVPDRDVAELRTSLGFRTTSWLVLEAGFGTRMYAATIARQRWTAASLGAEFTLRFAEQRLEGLARIALQPGAAVSGLESPGPALMTAAGVRYRAGKATLAVSYGLERYDFPPAAGVERRERLSTLTFLATWSP